MNRRKSHQSWMTCTKRRDPRKLSTSPRWPSLHLKYHLLLKTKGILGVVVWDFGGEEGNSHGSQCWLGLQRLGTRGGLWSLGASPPHGAQMKPSRGPVGSWAYKPFFVPHFLFLGNFSLHGLPWVQKGRFKQLLMRVGRGCGDLRGTVKNNSAILGHCHGPSSRNIDSNIFKFFYRTEAPSK